MFNITQGNTAQFIVRFLSSAGIAVTPSSGQVTVTYNSNGVSTASIVGLVLNGGVWIGNWDSTPADLGIASWVASSPASSLAAATGTLDIIDP